MGSARDLNLSFAVRRSVGRLVSAVSGVKEVTGSFGELLSRPNDEARTTSWDLVVGSRGIFGLSGDAYTSD